MAHNGEAEIEKGYSGSNEYGQSGEYTSEPFVHGAVTVAEATGRGGDTHRGLKSRHIQFLYVERACMLGDVKRIARAHGLATLHQESQALVNSHY